MKDKITIVQWCGSFPYFFSYLAIWFIRDFIIIFYSEGTGLSRVGIYFTCSSSHHTCVSYGLLANFNILKSGM